MVTRLSRPRVLALCALPVLALFGTAAFAPLPFTLAQPGTTANVLGDDKGTPVITIAGAPTRTTDGALLMTTIVATGPGADVGIGDVVDSWFRTDRAVMPRDSVYPTGGSEKEIEKHNLQDMRESQNVAVDAALTYLDRAPDSVDITLHLADVGGPSAGLFFSLGIIDKLDGDGSGGDLTGGRTVAGTGTIEADGTVGAVGGVSMKTQAARRDGASVFLVPEAECKEARAEKPDGLRLIPVTTLKGAVSSLRALEQGTKVPSC
ncbi:S16 family serine protease [Streptomyces sp. B1I3]|uniref:S16 family serine protease n=1 Tax=Streptomyces sp. B1I3 TaxID=3042264 RepID=UPI00278572F7|nr:S16 family serine protease [Streptomyces sp. B1I3]MDQ0796115.1 PDZ domain-containing protein [Streptomyces sp. B1I3]